MPLTIAWAFNAGRGGYVADQLPHTVLLPALYTHVIIPQPCSKSFKTLKLPGSQGLGAHPPTWFEIRPTGHILPVTEMPDLGDSERGAIVLVQELQADFLLIDEEDGRREAHSRALTITGTLGVLERAAIRGLIDLPTALARLQATTFRARPALFQDLLARDAARKLPA